MSCGGLWRPAASCGHWTDRLLTAGSHSSTGSEFQTIGPPTEKARRQSVLRRYLRTIKRCRLADRRCRLATSATGVQQFDLIPQCFVLQTLTDRDTQLILHAFWLHAHYALTDRQFLVVIITTDLACHETRSTDPCSQRARRLDCGKMANACVKRSS